MMTNSKTELVSVTNHSAFAEEVDQGLSANPKTLPSKYFYDATGDKIFQEIMAMEEYYLTRAEHWIFEHRKTEILNAVTADEEEFRLLELGAGDGLKTRVLLEYFIDQEASFDYSPVDISDNVLQILTRRMQQQLPSLHVTPRCGDYFEVLSKLEYKKGLKNLVFFLGSNIGNFDNEKAIEFLSRLRRYLNEGDMLLIGFDLRKNPDTILNAYNDKGGVTRRFNLNLLERINRELGGDIDVSAFEHYPIYNPSTGECKSYLINTRAQDFYIEALEKHFHLEPWEPIFTEVSKKYSLNEINNLCERSGFHAVEEFYDERNYFVDVLWKA